MKRLSRAGTSSFPRFFDGCSFQEVELQVYLSFPDFFFSFPLQFLFLAFSFPFLFLSSSFPSFPSFPSPFFFLSFPLPFLFPPSYFPFLSSPFPSFPFLSVPFLSFPLRYNLPMSHIEKEVFALRINEF